MTGITRALNVCGEFAAENGDLHHDRSFGGACVPVRVGRHPRFGAPPGNVPSAEPLALGRASLPCGIRDSGTPLDALGWLLA